MSPLPDEPAPAGRRVLVLAAAPAGGADDAAWLHEALAPTWTIETLDTGRGVIERLGRGDVGAVILGGALRDMTPAALLDVLRPHHGEDAGGQDGDLDADHSDEPDAARATGEAETGASPAPNTPPGPGASGGAGHDHGDAVAADSALAIPILSVDAAARADDRVFYVLRPGIAPEDLRALVRSALPRETAPPAVTTPLEARRVQRVLEVSRTLATHRDLASASAVVNAAVCELVAADRAYCLFHDRESGALWSEGSDESDATGIDATATRSVAGFVARTGRTVAALRADADPRYERAVDDPPGDGSERLLVHPVVSADGEIHAVLSAVRLHTGSPFNDRDGDMLALLASHIAPVLVLLALQIESQQVIDEAEDSHLFRREALDAHKNWQAPGDVLRISPAWTSWAYRLVVAACAVLLAYAAVGRVSEYSSGPAVIRMTGRTEITADIAGTIAAVNVVPGQRVTRGQILVQLHAADAEAELHRAEQEFEAALRNFLRAPGSVAERQTVASLRAQRERALARVRERALIAPSAGVVSDVRIRPGQALAPGDYALSVTSDDSDLTVIALLPGGDRPQLAAGMRVRLELSGYRYAYQDLVVDTVADEVIGPTEAARYLGPVLEGSVRVAGPVVLVKARLPSTTFDADGQLYRYHDGMLGLAEIRIRDRTILETLIPALERL